MAPQTAAVTPCRAHGPRPGGTTGAAGNPSHPGSQRPTRTSLPLLLSSVIFVQWRSIPYAFFLKKKQNTQGTSLVSLAKQTGAEQTGEGKMYCREDFKASKSMFLPKLK